MNRAFAILAVMFLVFNYCWATKKGKRRNHRGIYIVGTNKRRMQGS